MSEVLCEFDGGITVHPSDKEGYAFDLLDKNSRRILSLKTNRGLDHSLGFLSMKSKEYLQCVAEGKDWFDGNTGYGMKESGNERF